MENGPGSNQEFDWLLFGQNPTNSLPPSSSTANGGYSATANGGYSTTANGGYPAMGSSSSMWPVNHNNGSTSFLNHSVLPFQNTQQQQLPPPAAAMGSHLGGVNVNPVRSVLNHRDRYPSRPALLPDFNNSYPFEYDDQYCNTCDQLYCDADYHPAGYPPYGFRSPVEAPYVDRNLDIDFNRLNISSPNHHHLMPYLPSPSSNIRNNLYNQMRGPPVNYRNTGCNDICCNPRLVVENSIRSREWISDNYQLKNPSSNINYNPSPRQRGRQPRFPADLKEMRGVIYLVAKDLEGCQYLQSKCDAQDPEEIEMMFTELKDHIRELMVDPSMNYLAQKLFKVLDDQQLTHIVFSVVGGHGNFTSICQNSHGTRAMQRLIEVLTTAEQRSLIVSALTRITASLIKNTNGHHVIQNCLKSFPVHECQPILDVVADNCIDIATDKSGCCVLQQCTAMAVGLTKDRILTPIIENSLRLSEHQYGNYVVQHTLGMEKPHVIAKMVKRIAGNFVSLAMNKFASNVVESFLKEASYDDIIAIQKEFINSQNFLSVITHPYGNYVAQSVLHSAKDAIKETMIQKILKEYASLHSHPHGKRVLALARSYKPKVLARA